MSAATPHGQTPYYFVPAPSQFPVLTAIAMLLVIFGAGQWVNGHGWGAWVTLACFLFWAWVLQGWFRQAISESEGGLYGKRIDISFRWSMSWFIFSEVMFFAAFFGAALAFLAFFAMRDAPACRGVKETSGREIGTESGIKP